MKNYSIGLFRKKSDPTQYIIKVHPEKAPDLRIYDGVWGSVYKSYDDMTVKLLEVHRTFGGDYNAPILD